MLHRRCFGATHDSDFCPWIRAKADLRDQREAEKRLWKGKLEGDPGAGNGGGSLSWFSPYALWEAMRRRCRR